MSGSTKMATHKAGKGPRGEYRKREGWSGSRDYNKSGSSSPGPRRNNQWHSNYRSDSPRDYRDHHPQKECVQYLLEEWKKVEQELQKEATKDSKITRAVEYIEKNPTDIKADELCDVYQYLKNRRAEKPD